MRIQRRRGSKQQRQTWAPQSRAASPARSGAGVDKNRVADARMSSARSSGGVEAEVGRDPQR